MGENKLIGMLFLGIAIGNYIPTFPEPIAPIQQYIGLIFLIIAVILFIKN